MKGGYIGPEYIGDYYRGYWGVYRDTWSFDYGSCRGSGSYRGTGTEEYERPSSARGLGLLVEKAKNQLEQHMGNETV